MFSFKFHHIFSSHAVLQRNQPIALSGKAYPGHSVSVTFNGQTNTVVSDNHAEWQTVFPALPAGGPYEITATEHETGKNLRLEDILIGDVWMCAGQSNMAMPVWSANPFFRTANAELECANANYPLIRLCNCMNDSTLAPDAPLDELLHCEWQPCSPETVKGFSACGYFFGRQLHTDLAVPVGLVATAWGATDITSWISKRKMDSVGWEPYRESQVHGNVDNTRERWDAFLASPEGAALRSWITQFEQECPYSEEIAAESFDDSGWKNVQDGLPATPEPGRYAHRLRINVPEELAGHAMTLQTGPFDDADTTFINGQKIGHTGIETPMYWSVNRMYEIPQGVTHAGINIVTVIHDDHFFSGNCNLKFVTLLENGNSYLMSCEAKTKILHLLPADFPVRPDNHYPEFCASRTPAGPNAPCTLFNARIAPWLRFNFCGVIWYQGCHNNGQLTYYQLHRMLIEDWREQWDAPILPFLIVQLASFEQCTPDHRLTDEEAEHLPGCDYEPFAITREIQAEMEKCFQNVAVIPTFDIGDHSDIHPRNKQDVGFRLAKRAEKMLYNALIIAQGPTFDGIRIEKEKIRVFFDNIGSGLTTADEAPPKGFVISGRDGQFLPAHASIDGDTVLVSNPAVPEPQCVRYAFTSFCRVNLCNKERFPAMPFRSDKIDYAAMLHG